MVPFTSGGIASVQERIFILSLIKEDVECKPLLKGRRKKSELIEFSCPKYITQHGEASYTENVVKIGTHNYYHW